MERRKYIVTVNGKRYEVEVETSAKTPENEVRRAAPPPAVESPIARPAATRKASSTGSPKEFRAPINGVILEVFVSPGQSVKEKEALCSIEAMKMKTSIYSERDGVVEAIHIKAGDRIETSQLLFSFS